MAVYRQVQTSFWQDGFILDLTPEEKYFYLYLLTNEKTTQCGIYELPKKIIEIETGYNRETVDKLLQRFIDYKKILYSEETQEVMILNWIKYNKINSPNVKERIKKELYEVKNKDYVNTFYTVCKGYGYEVYTPDEVSENNVDTPDEVSGSNKEDKDKDKDKDTNTDKDTEIDKKKNKYADCVLLTEAEYQKLVKEHGERATQKMIETLDNYKGAKGKRYKSDYKAILSWVVEKVKKEHPGLFKPPKEENSALDEILSWEAKHIADG